MSPFNFTGTGVAIITPFTNKNEVDYPSLENLINHLVKGKVDYIVTMGTTGESVTLAKQEKQEAVKFTIDKVAGRLPVVLGIGGNNTHEILHQIESTDYKGIEGILSVSPYYNKPSQEGIFQHYQLVAKAAPVPVILYNVPGRTGSNLTAETTLRLANESENIVAIKEASGNLEQCMKIIRSKPKHFSVISGDDNLTLPILASGGIGVISVVANAFPLEFSEMVRACLQQDFTKARSLHYNLFEITEQLFADGNPGGIKAALKILGICGDNVRLPLVNVNDKVYNRLADLMVDMPALS